MSATDRDPEPVDPSSTDRTASGPGTASGQDPLSPAESLELIDAQRREAARAFYGTPVPTLLVWGITWLVGFGAYFFATWGGHRISQWLAGAVLVVLGATATATSVLQLRQQRRGVRGPSPAVATRYAWAWPIGVAGTAAFDVGLDHHGVPPSVDPVLWPASFLLVAGLLYLAGGVVYDDRIMRWLGGWTVAVATASTFAGAPGNFAVLSLAGGGGLLLAAALQRPRFRRTRPTEPAGWAG